MDFLIVTDPSQLKSPGAQALIRANATRLQHLRRRQEETFRHDSKTRDTHRKQRAKKTASNNVPAPSTSGSTSQDTESECPPVPPLPCERMYSTGARAFQTLLLRDSENTVGRCLVQLGTNLGILLGHFVGIIDLHTPEFERRFGHYGFQGIVLRSSLYPFIYTDAAPMAASLLMAVTYSLADRGEQPSDNAALLQLRGFVMQTIQAALSEDADYAVSDQVILAVIFIAKIDAMCGWAESHATHMNGLMRMVRLRGGQMMLGLDGILRMIMLWFDDATAYMLGRDQLYCDHINTVGSNLSTLSQGCYTVSDLYPESSLVGVEGDSLPDTFDLENQNYEFSCKHPSEVREPYSENLPCQYQTI